MVSIPVFSGPCVDLEGIKLAGVLQALDDRVEGRGDAIVHLDIAHCGRRRQDDRALLDTLVRQALDQRLAGDRGSGGVLAGVAEAAAVEDRAVEGIGRGDRYALRLGGLDDVVIGADLGRCHDQAVDRRILHDLVQDFDLAGRVVGRRFRAEQQYLGADQVAGDGRADIDRIEEAIAGRMCHDGESEVTIGRMEVLGAGGLLCGFFEAVAADRFLDAARLRVGVRDAER